jgi:hypothetical protein
LKILENEEEFWHFLKLFLARRNPEYQGAPLTASASAAQKIELQLSGARSFDSTLILLKFEEAGLVN